MPLTMISAVTVKIMILGDSGVGKSQLFSRLVRNTFDEDSLPTAGIDFATHVMKVSSGQKVKAQIVDTSGLDRFRTIIQSYWALATGALVVYDITNRESFSNIRRWVQDFRAKCNKGLPPSIMVVGNKAEKESEPYREVSTSEAKAYAVAQGFLFMEVSAMDDKDVDLAFSILLTDVYHAVNANSPTPILPIVSPRRGSSPALDPILSSNSGSANASSSRRPSAASVIDAAGDEGTLSRLVHWISGSATDNQGPSPSTSNTVPSDPTSATYVPPNPNAGLPRRASTVSSSYFWPFSSTEESTTSTPSSPSRSAANAVIDGATRAQQALAEAFRSRPPIKTVDDVDSDDDGVSGLRKSSNATSDGYLTSFYDIARNLVGGGEEDRTPPPALSSSYRGPSPTFGGRSPYSSGKVSPALSGGVILPPRRESVAATVLETGIIPMPVPGASQPSSVSNNPYQSLSNTLSFRRSYPRGTSLNGGSPQPPSSHDGDDGAGQSPTSDSAIALSSSATTPTAGIMLQMEPIFDDEEPLAPLPAVLPRRTTSRTPNATKLTPPQAEHAGHPVSIQPIDTSRPLIIVPSASLSPIEDASPLLPSPPPNAFPSLLLPRPAPTRSASMIVTSAPQPPSRVTSHMKFEMDLASLGGGLVDDKLSSTVDKKPAPEPTPRRVAVAAEMGEEEEEVAALPVFVGVDLVRRNTVAAVRRKKRSGMR